MNCGDWPFLFGVFLLFLGTLFCIAILIEKVACG